MEDVKIYAEEIEDEARKQVEELAALRPFKEQRIRVMPDAHAGIGCVVASRQRSAMPSYPTSSALTYRAA